MGSVVRQLFAMPGWEVPILEMPYPDPLLDLCEVRAPRRPALQHTSPDSRCAVARSLQGIYIVRHERYRGHLRDEKKLFLLLIRLFRSPDMLLRITKDKLES